MHAQWGENGIAAAASCRLDIQLSKFSGKCDIGIFILDRNINLKADPVFQYQV
jgi:hypothetical protein